MAAAKPPYRPGVVVRAWRNFLDSLSPRRMYPEAGSLMGRDTFGNEYFEIPADPSRGKRRPVRWFKNKVTGEKDILGKDVFKGFDAEVPAEWESWLRYRRHDPPTPEQVAQSLALADLKKRNAARLEAEREQSKAGSSSGVLVEGASKTGQQQGEGEKPAFPRRKEFEIMPGEGVQDGEDRWKSYKNPYSTKNGGQ